MAKNRSTQREFMLDASGGKLKKILPRTSEMMRFPKTVTPKNSLSPRRRWYPRVIHRHTCIGTDIVYGDFEDLEDVSGLK